MYFKKRYAIIGGGILTTIGTSTTVIITGLNSKYNQPQIGFHEMFYVTGPCFLLLLIYLYIFSNCLLPKKFGLVK
jgi:di/tricarboxylate transporter